MIWVLLQSESPWQQRQDNKATIPAGSCTAHKVALVIYPSKGIKCHRKIILKQIAF